jgi:hypothetical protein
MATIYMTAAFSPLGLLLLFIFINAVINVYSQENPNSCVDKRKHVERNVHKLPPSPSPVTKHGHQVSSMLIPVL